MLNQKLKINSMKQNSNIFIISLFLLVATFCANAQAPDRLSYQGVIRNASNALVTNQTIGMKVSILQGSAFGSVVFAETQLTATNTNGLATILIGNGVFVSGNLSTINWANGPYFIKTETDPNGGTNYSITATTQLMSVPYALYAKKSTSTDGVGTLDQAYDYGAFKGAGRTIIADSGAFKITGEDGLLVTGTFGAGTQPEVQGGGTRMFFNPRKASLRAGNVISTQWDSTNVGTYSTAFGKSTIASGSGSFAAGNNAKANGSGSTAMGNFTLADESSATAFGTNWAT